MSDQSKYKHGMLVDEVTVSQATTALVGVNIGSQTDWPTIKPCCDTLEELGVPFEHLQNSAHRTGQRMMRYASEAEGRGLKIIIACAGGSAHLPGMMASETLLPTCGVAPKSDFMGGLDAVASMIRMPKWVPLSFMGVGEAGAINAAVFAARTLALNDPELRDRLDTWWRAKQGGVSYRPYLEGG